MAELIYYDMNNYTGIYELFPALKSIPNFWDEVDDENLTLTKGGVTLEVSARQTKGVRGYGRTFSVTFDAMVTTCIAATEKGLLFNVGNYAVGIACDKNGAWGGALTSASNTPSINDILADNVTATTYGGTAAFSSTTNTQIIDLASSKGAYIFEDLCRILMSTNSVLTYTGRLTMSNGEKFVKAGALVLRYS